MMDIFTMCERNDWQGIDSVYDAWLVANQRPRDLFPMEIFEAEFPDWETDLVESYQKYLNSLPEDQRPDETTNDTDEMEEENEEAIDFSSEDECQPRKIRRIYETESEDGSDREVVATEISSNNNEDDVEDRKDILLFITQHSSPADVIIISSDSDEED